MNKTFNWHETEYPCLGIRDNNLIVCFSAYGIGHLLDGKFVSPEWIMEQFKPYTKPKEPKTESWARYRMWSSESRKWFVPNSYLRNLEEVQVRYPSYSHHQEIENTRVNLMVVE